MNSEPRPPTRAQRLQAAALAEQSNAPNAPPETAKTPRASSGGNARALHKRIREVLKEQTQTVYGAPQEVESTPEFTPEIAKPAAGSWESLADEIVPQNAPVNGRRGLATGANRGASIPNPQKATAHPQWLSAPAAPRAILCANHGREVLLHDALCGEEKTCETHGAHYLVSRAASEYDAAFSFLRARLAALIERETFPQFSGANVKDLLFVDIETTGLSASQPLFLIGALELQNEPQLSLFLARDYPEERAALAAFHELARGKTLVTFNGKSFDWPYLAGRSTAHRLNFSDPRAHFDLLHHARRTWKHSLPNCKLQTLELYLCGRTRVDDMPGSQIPAAYHEFVATHAATGGGAHLMAPILHHNALDILTMAELVCLAGES